MQVDTWLVKCSLGRMRESRPALIADERHRGNYITTSADTQEDNSALPYVAVLLLTLLLYCIIQVGWILSLMSELCKISLLEIREKFEQNS